MIIKRINLVLNKLLQINTNNNTNTKKTQPKPTAKITTKLAITALLCISAVNVQAKPNLIFILADDLGYGDVGAFGQSNFATPNLDKMAQEGIKFTDFYAGSAVCAPSRSVLMTGQHVGNTRIKSNTQTVMIDGKKQKRGAHLLAEDFTIAEMLKQAGYHNGIIGKWGLGEPDDEGHPLRQGFDYFYGYLNHVHAHNHFPAFLWRNHNKVKLKNEVTRYGKSAVFGFQGGVATKRIEYADDLIRDESLAFIERNKNHPFFLFVSLISPHANNEARFTKQHGLETPSYGEFKNKAWPEPQKGYAAMVQHIDNTVGAILAKLKSLKIDNNTLVMFSSDNGPHKEAGGDPEYFQSSGGLRGFKRSPHDGGVRVPTIAWGPNIIAKAQVSNRMAYFGDIMATYADLANIKTPDNTDSLSFAPLLTNTGKQANHEYLYWEFYASGSWQAVRIGDWKAVRKPLDLGNIELYDINQDPAEQHNLAKQKPNIVKRIKQIMDDNYTPTKNWQPSYRKNWLKNNQDKLNKATR